MPKILINEKDYTNPGAPGSYANYAVLIPGFMGNGDRKTVKPDTNGVYEFQSYQDFEDTIGIVEPQYQTDAASISHYGNQMAYELLKQGYTVVYLPVDKDNLATTLSNAATWEIFKDKTSYDFRFVHHGFLDSTDPTIIKAREEQLDAVRTTVQTLVNKGIVSYTGDTSEMVIGGTTYELEAVPNQDFEEVVTIADAYTELLGELTDPDNALEDDNLKGADGDYYTDWREAVKAVATLLLSALTLHNACITTTTINKVNTNIANLAKYAAEDSGAGIPGRGDCVALIELDENSYVNVDSADKPEVLIRSAIQELSSAIGDMEGCGKYCALTVPSVYYVDDRKFPGGFHYLSCFMNALKQGFKEWYAAAGYTRGVSSYVIDHTSVSLGEIAINALEPRQKQVDGQFACNVIANFRGSYYLWGNRTAHPLDDADLTASSFLNIRQLCTTIKKQLYVACRRFTFDPNNDTLWFNFVNAIRPTLDEMKADQGIRDYKIMKVTTDKKATLKAKIRIIPIEAVEDFDLEISLEDSFGDTVVTATESV